MEIALLRYKLRLFLNCEGHFECPELQAVVDNDQNLSTLFGLENKLVLRDIRRKNCRVLIPYGSVVLSKSAGHVKVVIEAEHRVKCGISSTTLILTFVNCADLGTFCQSYIEYISMP